MAQRDGYHTKPKPPAESGPYAKARRLWMERAESGLSNGEIARLFARETVAGGLTINKENAWLNTFANFSGALYRFKSDGMTRPAIALALLDHMKLGEEHRLLELFERHYGRSTVHEAAAALMNAGTKPAEIDDILAGKGYGKEERLKILEMARRLNKLIIASKARG